MTLFAELVTSLVISCYHVWLVFICNAEHLTRIGIVSVDLYEAVMPLIEPSRCVCRRRWTSSVSSTPWRFSFRLLCGLFSPCEEKSKLAAFFIQCMNDPLFFRSLYHRCNLNMGYAVLPRSRYIVVPILCRRCNHSVCALR